MYYSNRIIAKATGRHSYDVETKTRNGARGHVWVQADNRTQAAKAAEKAGFLVFSVNMTG